MQMTQIPPAVTALTRAGLEAAPGLERQLRALNNAHAAELSWLEEGRLRELVGAAFFAARIGAAEAFLLAFDQDAPYRSPNFLWFRARYDRFVYVDRVVVAAGARGRGYARTLYGAAIAQARAAGQSRIVCEVNAVPPNPASDAFHAGLGFAAVGQAALPGAETGTDTGTEKIVRYLARDLDTPATPDLTGGRS